ncbi:protein phosphatase 1 regulatory subunit 12A-like isoform X2 [Watersipora subatra]|uniref:protein phosphatase 1 regulatory subunit 12A-like isoform X2 n=1 Tax=Watersipora subatra TaxID=2589382 RepID=UPI00355C45BF
MLKPADPNERKPAAFRRKEQVDRWQNSSTDQQGTSKKDGAGKVRFDRGTIFLAACGQCDLPEVGELIEKGVDPNTTNVDGLTGLHQACIDDKMQVVEYLVDNGASINVRDNEGWTPLHATASCGYIDIAGYLINKGADIAACNVDGDLPIDLAEGRDMENLLAVAMNRQSVNADAARKAEERNILNDANERCKNPDMPEYEDKRTGATALHVAAVKGYHAAMLALIKAGAAINHQDRDGWTPLHGGAHWRQEDSCRILIDHGCDTTIRDHGGLTAIDVADKTMAKFLKDQIERKEAQKAQENMKDEIGSNMISTTVGIKRRPSVTRMSIEEKEKLSHNSLLQEKSTLLNLRLGEEQDTDERKISTTPNIIPTAPENDASGENEEKAVEDSQPISSPFEGSSNRLSNITRNEETNSGHGEPASHKDNKETEPSAPAKKVEDTSSTENRDKFEEQQALRRSSGPETEQNSSDPTSWRASLRKTGSSSSVSETVEHHLPSVTKSASATAVAGNEGKTSSSSSSANLPVQVRVDNRRPFVALRDQGLSERSSYPVTAGRSQYVPYYRRQQMEREAKAKMDKEVTKAATSAPSQERRVGRFVTPQRDDEAETNRKIKAKRARETRRSTQGVTQDDVKAAEATLKSAETEKHISGSSSEPAGVTDQPVSNGEPASVRIDSNSAVVVRPEDLSAEPARRRAWGRSVSYDPPSPLGPYAPDISSASSRPQDEGRSSSFRKARDTIISGGSASSVPDALASSSAYARYRNGDLEPSEARSRLSWRSENKENNNKKAKDEEEDTDKDQKKPRLLRSRRNRRERRSTGVINYDENEKNEEEKEQDTSELSENSISTEASSANSSNVSGTNWASRPFTRRYGSTSDVPTQMASGNVGDKSDRSSYSSRYSRRPTSVLDSSSEVDYKAQCEELKVENEHLKEKLKNVEEQLLQSNRNASNRSSSTETQMTDRRERRAMERRISELEEEHEKMQSLIKDNTRLKEENGALIRVISKLSK